MSLLEIQRNIESASLRMTKTYDIKKLGKVWKLLFHKLQLRHKIQVKYKNKHTMTVLQAILFTSLTLSAIVLYKIDELQILYVLLLPIAIMDIILINLDRLEYLKEKIKPENLKYKYGILTNKYKFLEPQSIMDYFYSINGTTYAVLDIDDFNNVVQGDRMILIDLGKNFKYAISERMIKKVSTKKYESIKSG